jgi:hypothetical protein
MKNNARLVLLAGLISLMSVLSGQSALAGIKPDPEVADSLQGTKAQFPLSFVVAETTTNESAKEKPKESEEDEEEELDEDDC